MGLYLPCQLKEQHQVPWRVAHVLWLPPPSHHSHCRTVSAVHWQNLRLWKCSKRRGRDREFRCTWNNGMKQVKILGKGSSQYEKIIMRCATTGSNCPRDNIEPNPWNPQNTLRPIPQPWVIDGDGGLFWGADILPQNDGPLLIGTDQLASFCVRDYISYGKVMSFQLLNQFHLVTTWGHTKYQDGTLRSA